MASREPSDPRLDNPDTYFTESIPVGNLPTQSVLTIAGWNFVLIHRHYDPLMQKWGNMCSKIVSVIANRAADEKPIRWYHKKLWDFCYKQYDRYGDYYRMIDSSFTSAEEDTLLEVQ